MNNKESQIEDVASIFLKFCEDELGTDFVRDIALDFAKIIYDSGYRKQGEGEWEIVKGSNGKEIMVCTKCRHSQDLHSTFTHCPNCGARMRGAKMKGGE